MKESKLCEMINSRVQVEGGLFLKEAVYFRRTGKLKLLFLIKRPVTSALREEVQKTAAELVPTASGRWRPRSAGPTSTRRS